MASAYSQFPNAPGPGMLSFFSEAPEFRKDPLAGFLKHALKFGDIVRYRGLWVTHQLSHPDHIQQVLQTNVANYRKGRDYRILKLSLGEGLLTSDGALWQRQRKMTQPAFHSGQIAGFVRIMDRHALVMMERWQKLADSGEVFDVLPDLMRLTLNIVSEALFSTNLESDVAVIKETLDIGRDYTVDRAWSVVKLPKQFPTRKNLRHQRSLAKFHAILDRMVAERRSSALPINDLLSMLMNARDEDGEPMSDAQLRDEMATLLTAGHETTTLVLAWALFLIGSNPGVAERMAAELKFLDSRAPAYEDLSRLRYTRNVAEETMRLYPPVWVLSRTAIGDDEMGGYKIPAGSEILIFPYVTHRHPKWWTEPDKFDPERFLPERTIGRMRGAYLPFGLGQRTCIGLNFAMTEILVVLALIMQRFQVELAMDPAQMKLDASVTLRPKTGVPIRLHKLA